MTQQHSLSPDQIALFSEPRVRATDPDTSRDAAKKVEPGAETLERQIMERFAIFIRMTDERLVELMPHRNDGSVISARGRLKNRGLLESSKTKEKNVGGCEMTVWRITAAGYESIGWRMP